MSRSLTRWASNGLRVGPWRGEAGVAYLAPRAGAQPASLTLVEDTMARLRAAGFRRAITAALEPTEATGFLSAGFEITEHLHVLVRNVAGPPGAPDVPLRRARRGDRSPVLAIDGLAFAPFWQLDAEGLDDALAATPTARFRVGVDPDGTVVAYGIWGRAGSRGYLQRLAVDPSHHRAGYGTALVVDGLRWLGRRGSDTAVVNTQIGNDTALALYERLGFRRQAGGLVVLRIDLEP